MASEPSMQHDKSIKILFVCMGNICRSPTAHGIFRDLVERSELSARITIDSAGTHAFHVGSPPDRRAQETARRRGTELGDIAARAVCEQDFTEFDYILAMDRDNLSVLNNLCPEAHAEKLHLMMDFAPEAQMREVPDPYYGGARGFDRVYDMLESAASGLLARVRRDL